MATVRRKSIRSSSVKKSRGQGLQRFFIIFTVVLLILIIAGIFYYQSYIGPFQRVIFTVDNNKVKMGYFLKRAKLAGVSDSSMVQQLVYEQIIKNKAPQLGITVTEDDINNALRQAAIEDIYGSSEDNTVTSISEKEFQSWYREKLRVTGLTDAEYRDMVRLSLLSYGLQQYLTQDVPANTEQVHLYIILTATLEEARAAKARIEAGESFTDVAKEVSIDSSTKENGGDMGWVPRGMYKFDDVIFSLNIGKVSDPFPVDSENPDTSQYLLFMVSAKEANRPISVENFQMIISDALKTWLNKERTNHVIKINYDVDDAENQAWITWQLSRMASSYSSASTTQSLSNMTTTVTPVTPSVNYKFEIYRDNTASSPLTNKSLLNMGEVTQASLSTLTLYIKNVGDEVSEPIIVNAMNLTTGINVYYDRITLGASGSVTELELTITVEEKKDPGTYSFDLMFSRGSDAAGYCLVVPARVTVVKK